MLRNNQRDHYIVSTILILQTFIAVKRYVHGFMKILILLFSINVIKFVVIADMKYFQIFEDNSLESLNPLGSKNSFSLS